MYLLLLFIAIIAIGFAIVYKQYVVAAAIGVGIGLYFWFNRVKPEEETDDSETTTSATSILPNFSDYFAGQNNPSKYGLGPSYSYIGEGKNDDGNWQKCFRDPNAKFIHRVKCFETPRV